MRGRKKKEQLILFMIVTFLSHKRMPKLNTFKVIFAAIMAVFGTLLAFPSFRMARCHVSKKECSCISFLMLNFACQQKSCIHRFRPWRPRASGSSKQFLKWQSFIFFPFLTLRFLLLLLLLFSSFFLLLCSMVLHLNLLLPVLACLLWYKKIGRKTFVPSTLTGNELK